MKPKSAKLGTKAPALAACVQVGVEVSAKGLAKPPIFPSLRAVMRAELSIGVVMAPQLAFCSTARVVYSKGDTKGATAGKVHFLPRLALTADRIVAVTVPLQGEQDDTVIAAPPQTLREYECQKQLSAATQDWEVVKVVQ